MSKLLINQYLNELSRLRQVGGMHRESVVREAFKDLLKGYARSHDLVFVPEFEIESPAREPRYVDGALLHALRLPFGYWEAKDEKDDLDAEIALKFKRGYPQDNIIFDDSTQVVLIQNSREVIRCRVDDTRSSTCWRGSPGERGNAGGGQGDACPAARLSGAVMAPGGIALVNQRFARC